jgi:hypothetical protein
VNDTDCAQNEVCGSAGQCCATAKSSCAIDKDETDLITGCIITSKKNCQAGTVCNLETGECDEEKVCETIKNCMEYDASCFCKSCNSGYVLSNGGKCVAENRNCPGGTWLTGKNGDKFCLSNTGSSWDKAKAWCENLGMSLASAKSACAANVKNCICDNAGLGDCSVGCCVNFTGIKHPNTSDSVLMWLTDIDCSNNKGEIIPCEESDTHYLVDLGSGRINTFSGWMNLSYALCE